MIATVLASGEDTLKVLLVICAILLGATIPSLAVEFVVESSFPRIDLQAPADLTLEGSVVVTVTADAEVTPLEPESWLIQVGENAWTTLFRWFETEQRTVRFEDADGQIHRVTLAPSPRMPLDHERHQLPVLSITIDPAHLWDADTGIYAWGLHNNCLQHGEEWERPALLEYFEADGTPVFAESIGLRINGETSRAGPQKGLRIYFDDYGASDVVVHDFFGDGPAVCERLVLRAAAFADFAIGSGMAEPLHMELGHPGSRWSYVAAYVNGEYWGAYSLRERFDSKWVETTHDWADDDYLVIKDHEAQEGDYQRWEDLLDAVAEGDPTTHAWFQWYDGQLDLTAYLDWVLINTSMHTADNMHGKNMAVVKIGGDRFRFMAWDEDILFQTNNLWADHFSFYASSTVAEYNAHRPLAWFSGGPWDFTFRWNALLNRGMRNAEFKALFRARAAELLDGPLSIRGLTERLDALAARQGPEWVHHEVRWNPPVSYAVRVNSIRSRFAARHEKMLELVAEFLATWADPVELSAFSVAAAEEGNLLRWHTEREVGCDRWLVERSLDTPGAFTALVEQPSLGGPDTPVDYEIVDTTAPSGRDAYYRLTHVDLMGTPHVHDWVEGLVLPLVFHLRLNEFMAANDSTVADEAGEYDDWVEITNVGPESVDLAGLFLTDNLSTPTKWALPDDVLAPGAHRLIWCDEDLTQGPWHASFKLSAGGEELGIFSGFAHDHAVIDSHVFGPQIADVSTGRMPDGDGPWVICEVATPGSPNDVLAASPLAVTSVRLAPAWPNPATGVLTLSGLVPPGVGPARLTVYDVRGQRVRELAVDQQPGTWQRWQWDGCNDSGRPAAAGVYVVQLQAGDERAQQRVVLVR